MEMKRRAPSVAVVKAVVVVVVATPGATVMV